MLVGFESADDAGVFRIDAERALVQTLDFFTPVVDDPALYGAVAAANSLSDVYAMGGVPLTAMAIACFPDRPEELDLLSQIMLGGSEKLREAGVSLLGGHTVVDPEIKFGYSVTGLVHPARIVTNGGALPGDALVLTKPLGIGILTTAIKRGRADAEAAQKVAEVMTMLNRDAAEAMLAVRCHAATDITGYGLIGHAREMALASRATLHFRAGSIPYIPQALPLAQERVLPGLTAKTWKLVAADTVVGDAVTEPLRNILLDPQTSGGLLIAVHPHDLDVLLQGLSDRGVKSAHVGNVEAAQTARIIVD